MVSRQDAENTLRTTFGVEGFRPGQWEAVNAALSGRDTTVFLPTGAGKSMCYILPALLSPGLVVVISPLLSLMDDQVATLSEVGIAARSVSSARPQAENRATLEMLSASPLTLRLLFLSPETASTSKMLSKLVKLRERGRLSLLAVDEAHCICQASRHATASTKARRRRFARVLISTLVCLAWERRSCGARRWLGFLGCRHMGGPSAGRCIHKVTDTSQTGRLPLLCCLCSPSHATEPIH